MAYADVNGLHMYYELHGEGPPLLLLHGAFHNADAMRPLAEGLAATRQVIAPEEIGRASCRERV